MRPGWRHLLMGLVVTVLFFRPASVSAQFPPFGGGFGGRGGFGSRGDPGAFFDRLAQGKPTLSIEQAPFFLRDPLMQFAKEQGITNGQLTREQFLQFWAQRQQQRGLGGGPMPSPGMPGTGGAVPGPRTTTSPGPVFPGNEGPPGFPGPGGMRGRWPPGGGNGGDWLIRLAQQEFAQYDLNQDGFLTPDEIPSARHHEIFQYDSDRDNKINFDEYLMYVQSRYQARSLAPEQAPAVPETSLGDGEKRPTVYRSGKLPKELPAWFAQYDKDHDGQISLYEWRLAGESLEKFAQIDRDDDGFLTVEEVLRYQKLAQQSPPASNEQTASAQPPSPAGPILNPAGEGTPRSPFFPSRFGGKRRRGSNGP